MKDNGGTIIHVLWGEKEESSKQWSSTASTRSEGSKIRFSGRLTTSNECRVLEWAPVWAHGDVVQKSRRNLLFPSVSPHREHGYRDPEPMTTIRGGVESLLAPPYGDLRAVLPHSCRLRRKLKSALPTSAEVDKQGV
jgi:hypothetical protein